MNRTQRLIYLAVGAIAGVAIVLHFMPDDWVTTRPRPSSVLGRQGEWVTRPDGRRVCRLSADLLIYHRIDPSFCIEWQEPEPKIGQAVEGWIRSSEGRYQIMIEGSWRP